jgi:hypothetical protein
MRIEGTYTFDAPRDVVWQALMDPDVLAKALPGGQKLEQVGENRYEAALDVRVGPVQGRFDGEIEISDIQEPESYHMSVNGQGSAGFLNGEGDVVLSDVDEGTLMTYSGDAQVGGRIASVGQRLIDSTAKSLTRQGLESLDRQIEARQKSAEEGEPEAEVTAPSTVSVATTVARDVTKDTMDDFVSKAMAPERLPFTLAGAAIAFTLLFALIAWLIAG